MKIKLLAIGKMKNRPLAQVAEDYTRRIQKWNPFEVQDIAASSMASETAQLQQEAKKLEKKISANAHVIVLDEWGTQYSSPDLAKHLEKLLASLGSELLFILGGAYGLAPSIKARAQSHWSLSKLTLPHQLARVLALEQIYRAFTILKNMPYHHE